MGALRMLTVRLQLTVRAPLQFDKGLGATDGDVIEKYFLDPKLARGKRPGEGELGKMLCAALLERRVTPVLTTWATIDQRVSFLISEAEKWESAYGTLDKIPTGRAKCTRAVLNPDTNELEERDWPWEDWMWPMIRLGRQRRGQAVAAAVKEEQTVQATAHLAEQAVAKLQAQVLAAGNAERPDLLKKLEDARARLLHISGGRRGARTGKKARKRVKTEGERGGDVEGDSDGEEDEEEEESDSAGGEGVEPTRKGRSSGVDAGIAALLKDTREAAAASKAAMDRLSAEADKQRAHDAEQAEKQREAAKEEAAKQREHVERLEKMRAEGQKDLVLSLAAAMREFRK